MSIQYKFKPGDLIIKEGAIADRSYSIIEGDVLVFKTGKDDERIPLAKLKAGDTFGEIAVLTGAKRRTASVIALSEVKLDIYLDYELKAIMNKTHPYVRSLINTMLKQIKSTTASYIDKY